MASEAHVAQTCLELTAVKDDLELLNAGITDLCQQNQPWPKILIQLSFSNVETETHLRKPLWGCIDLC